MEKYNGEFETSAEGHGFGFVVQLPVPPAPDAPEYVHQLYAATWAKINASMLWAHACMLAVLHDIATNPRHEATRRRARREPLE